MAFSLAIDTSNSAFDDNPGMELARILREVADRIEDTPPGDSPSGVCRDVNGAKVGRWQVVEA